jgi:hypothetical protein
MVRAFVRQHFRGLTVVSLAVAVFILGFRGYQEYYRATQHERSAADLAYLTIQLFLVQAPDLDGPVNFRLHVARFAAPLAAAYAGFWAALSILYHQVQLARPRLGRDHVIVCGLGRKGSKLVQQFRRRGDCVVVIEQDENNRELEHSRQMGAIILKGAANERWVLEKAYPHRAKALIAIMGDDGVNVETAVLAHDLNQKRTSGALECVVHVFDLRLQKALKKHPIYTDTNDPFDLRFFNAFDTAAEAMLGSCPPAAGEGGPPHLLILGLGRLGETLLAQAAARWKASRADPNAPLYATLVDVQADKKRDAVGMRHPDLAQACRLEFVTMDVHFPHFPATVAGVEKGGMPPVTAAFVCLDNESSAMFAALALRECFQGRDVPIIVRMNEERGLASLLGTGSTQLGLIKGVRAVGLLDIACSLDLVLGSPPQRTGTS